MVQFREHAKQKQLKLETIILLGQKKTKFLQLY